MKNLQTTFALIALAICLLSFNACDDKEYTPLSPEFGELVLNNTKCAPGETVTATATIKKEGAYYYYFRIYYTVGSVTNIIEKDEIKTSTGELKFNFIAPTTPGTYNMSMKASVSYTTGNQLYGSTNSVSTKITVEE